MTDLQQKDFFEDLHRETLAFSRMEPELELTVRDPALDVEGYVVVWNAPEPACVGKGGTRVTPTVTIDEVRMLARTMALKNAAAGLPLGGAKSGIRANPNTPGFKQQFQSIARRFAPLFPEHGGPFGGLGFDLGGRAEFVDWFIEETGLPHRFTGKPASQGGTDYDVEGIAGLGVAVSARSALEARGGTAQGATFAVQGLGAMGSGVVRYFAEYGGVLRWLSDKRVGGSWELPESLDDSARADVVKAVTAMDLELLNDVLATHGKRIGSPQDVLYQKADVLFPCAVHDVIHQGNVEQVHASILAEGANGPCTAETREILQGRDVLVLPDFLANSGGIIAAHVEMTSDAEDKISLAKQRTIETIDTNVRAVVATSDRLSVTPYQAAMSLALGRVFGRVPTT